MLDFSPFFVDDDHALRMLEVFLFFPPVLVIIENTESVEPASLVDRASPPPPAVPLESAK